MSSVFKQFLPSVVGGKYVDPVTGREEVRAARVTDAGEISVAQGGAPRLQVTPTVGGSPIAEVTLDAGTGNVLIGMRITVNPGDSIVAATRLMNKYPDCVLSIAGDTIRLSASSAITNVTLVGVGDATSTAGNVISTAESTLANVQTAMIEFNFNSSDDVRVVEITLSDTFASGQKGQLQIAGYAS